MTPDAGDALYAAELDAFIAERSALAKALRADGDRAAATEVAKLRKPTVAAWVLNQLARRAPEALGGLLDAADGLRAATTSGEGVREAIGAHREAMKAALAAARGFEPNGRPPSDAVMEKVRDTLAAAALDEALAAALRGGRLVDEADPAAGGAAEAAPVAPTAATAKRSGGAGKGKRKQRVRPGATIAAERARAAERERAAAEEERRRAEEAERRLTQARERRDRAARHAAEARSAAEAADERLEEATRALTRAEKEQEAAHAAAEDAEAALADAEAALDRES